MDIFEAAAAERAADMERFTADLNAMAEAHRARRERFTIELQAACTDEQSENHEKFNAETEKMIEDLRARRSKEEIEKFGSNNFNDQQQRELYKKVLGNLAKQVKEP